MEKKEALVNTTEKLFCEGETKEYSEAEGTIVGWGSKSVVDRDGELIMGDAWNVERFMKNPVLMLCHDYSKPPVGKVLWAKATADGLKFKARFANSDAGKEIRDLYKDGIMNAFSVGFAPKPNGFKSNFSPKNGEAKKTFTNVELLEISCVPIPCCPDALIERYEKGMLKSDDLKTVVKGCIDSKVAAELAAKQSTLAEHVDESILKALCPEGKAATPENLKFMCSWYNATDEENPESYKLLHHTIDDEIYTEHLQKSMEDLLALKGEDEIPFIDRKHVYDHLAAHFKELELEVPEFKVLDADGDDVTEDYNDSDDTDDDEYQKALTAEAAAEEERLVAEQKAAEEAEQKAGRVLSGKNRGLLQSCVDSVMQTVGLLQQLLEETAPDTVNAADDAAAQKALDDALAMKMLVDAVKSLKEDEEHEAAEAIEADAVKKAIQDAFKSSAESKPAVKIKPGQAVVG